MAIETQTIPANSAAQPTPASTDDNNMPITALPEPTKEGEMPPIMEDTDVGDTIAEGTSVEGTNGTLWLQVFTPQEGDIVNQEVINVSGQAPAETVISLNEEIFLVTDEGIFTIPVNWKKDQMCWSWLQAI